jgi:hypothetical protein
MAELSPKIEESWKRSLWNEFRADLHKTKNPSSTNINTLYLKLHTHLHFQPIMDFLDANTSHEQLNF